MLAFKAEELEIDITTCKHGVIMRLAGELNEEFDFTQVLRAVALAMLNSSNPGDRILWLDLSGASRINSCGVRAWLLFIEGIQAKFVVRFAHVSEVFIEQSCSVPNMLGVPGTPIERVDLPYVCVLCNRRITITHQIESLVFDGASYQAPTARCQNCGFNMDFDALPLEYFHFMNKSGPST